MSDTVQRIQPGDELTKSLDQAAENRRKLAALFPGVFTETAGPDGVTPAVDVDALRDLVGATVDHDTREKFGLSWHGKSAARRLALTPSAGTLRPVPAESVDWDTTGNVLIEGDNLEVLKLLQKAYAGKVKLIYIDPPYNTGNDFVYKDDFRDPIGHYQRTIGDVDESGARLTTNTDTGGRFHTTWLNMIYPRLLLARELLREDGVIFVSIDDVEAPHLRAAMDEVFGPENFIAQIVWEGANKNDARQIGVTHEYVVGYSRQRLEAEEGWKIAKTGTQPVLDEAARLLKEYGDDFDTASSSLAGWFRSMKATESWAHRRFRKIDKRAAEVGPYKEDDPTAPGGRRFDLKHPDGHVIPLRTGRGWGFDQQTFDRMVADDRIVFVTQASIMVKRYLAETDSQTPQSIFYQPARSASERLATLMNGNYFDFPKDEVILGQFVEMASSGEDLILDFFAGSGTTGHAVMAQNAADGGNRRFVLVQLPEPTGRTDYKTIADLTAERLRRAGKKIKAEYEQTLGSHTKPLDTGFRTFKLDSANVKAWEAPTTDVATAQQITALLEGAVDAVKLDRTDADVLWGILINLGLPLDTVVEPRTVDGHTVHVAGGGTLMCCFEKTIDLSVGERLADVFAQIAKEKEVTGELTVVLRDASFGGKDAAKVNLVENLKQRLPDSVTKSRVLSI